MTIKLAYCDYIAHLIKKHLKDQDLRDKALIDTVGSIRFDLDQHGRMLSSKKQISVVDIQGKTYTITIEENDSGSTV
jgi:hypothetical protein